MKEQKVCRSSWIAKSCMENSKISALIYKSNVYLFTGNGHYYCMHVLVVSTWSTGSQISRSPCFRPFLKSLLVSAPPSTFSFLCCSWTKFQLVTSERLNGFHHLTGAFRCAEYLEYDLSLQLRGRGQLFGHLLHWFSQKFVSKHFFEYPRHLTLLLQRTVLLYGQDYRKSKTQDNWVFISSRVFFH